MSRPSPFAAPVFVARPRLPDLPAFQRRLEEIWASGWLANKGPQHVALERALTGRLGVPHLSLFNNGTTALMVACQALRLAGEVVTTPFTFPATPHVLAWNNIVPVFCDISPDTLCLDPALVPGLVTGRASAILGVHVYGIPCDVAAIDAHARHYGLKVLYDAAHAFDVRVAGRPLARYGDATMLSFHATKLFHTAEGGALCVADADLKRRIDLLQNFGIENEDTVAMPGINGKMNELQAALGLAMLDELDAEKAARAALRRIYRQRLAGVPGLRLIDVPADATDSQQYCILRVAADAAPTDRDTLHARLKAFNVHARKYFHPLCSDYGCYRQLPSAAPERLPHAHRAAREVMALPFYGALGEDGAQRVCDILLHCLENAD